MALLLACGNWAQEVVMDMSVAETGGLEALSCRNGSNQVFLVDSSLPL